MLRWLRRVIEAVVLCGSAQFGKQVRVVGEVMTRGHHKVVVVRVDARHGGHVVVRSRQRAVLAGARDRRERLPEVFQPASGELAQDAATVGVSAC